MQTFTKQSCNTYNPPEKSIIIIEILNKEPNNILLSTPKRICLFCTLYVPVFAVVVVPSRVDRTIMTSALNRNTTLNT